jgi:hypothetical protein
VRLALDPDGPLADTIRRKLIDQYLPPEDTVETVVAG